MICLTRVPVLSILLSVFTLVFVDQLPAWETKQAGEVIIEQHSFETNAKGVIHYELGTLWVPENRNEPDSRLISIGFARFPAKQKTPGVPPVFRLPGGPGSSFVSRLKSVERRGLDRMLPLVGRRV